MASLALAFDILAKDRASKTIDKVGDSAERTGDKASKMGLALGGIALVGVAGLVSALKGGMDEFAASQKGMAQFRAGLKSTGNVAGITADGVQDLADSIERKSGTDSAAIVSGAAMLTTFTKVRDEVGKGNDVFTRATQAGADLAARGFGSIESNAVQLGKALNDPIAGVAALGESGITFTAKQKDLIKSLVETGDVLSAQKIILKEVETQVGGSADAYGKTLPGQLDRAQAAFGQLKESAFKVALPALTGVLEFATDKLIPGFQGLADTIGPAAKAAFKTVADAVTSLKADLGPFIKTVTDQLKGIAQPLIDAVRVGLRTGDYTTLGSELGKALAKAITGAADAAASLTKAIGGLLAKVDFPTLALQFGRQAPTILLGFVTGLLNFDVLGLVRFAMDNLFLIIAGAITIAFAPAKLLAVVGRIPFLGPLIAGLLRGAQNAIRPLVNAVTGIVTGVARAFGRGFASVFPRVAGGLSDQLALLPIRIGLAGIALQAAAVRLVVGMAERLGSLGIRGAEALGRAFGQLTALLGRAGGSLAAGGRELAIRVVTAISKQILRSAQSLVESGQDMGRSLLRALSSTLPGKFLLLGADIIGGLVKGIRNGAGRVIRAVKEAITDKLPAFVKKALGIESPSKVFAALGKQIPAGLAAGISSGITPVRRALGDMTDLAGMKVGGTEYINRRLEQGRAEPGAAGQGGMSFGDIIVQGSTDPNAGVSVSRGLRDTAFRLGLS